MKAARKCGPQSGVTRETSRLQAPHRRDALRASAKHRTERPGGFRQIAIDPPPHPPPVFVRFATYACSSAPWLKNTVAAFSSRRLCHAMGIEKEENWSKSDSAHSASSARSPSRDSQARAPRQTDRADRLHVRLARLSSRLLSASGRLADAFCSNVTTICPESPL